MPLYLRVPRRFPTVSTTKTDGQQSDSAMLIWQLKIIPTWKSQRGTRFSLSGEDNVLGGGIYFQETFVSLPVQKNTICSAVTMLSCMKLYEITQDRQYLDAAIRINDWTVENLLDKSDNLLWDAKMVADGSVNTQKWSYNAGFMIRSY